MYQELQIKTPGKEATAFLQSGFYNNPSLSIFHNHNYTEVHLVLGGNAVFSIDGKRCEIKSGDMLVIPPQSFHACIRQDSSAKHTAFQIDYDASEFAVYSANEYILYGFFDEIKKCRETGDYTKLSAFMALLCCYFFDDTTVCARQVTDYGFLIHEFFSLHYNQSVQLCDLAALLHLSNRQTERLVVEHMGKTFRRAIASMRIMTAKRLIEMSDLPLNEIAEYVGYGSYAGFWKAMKKYHL